MMKPYLLLLCLTSVVPAILSLLRPVGHRYYVIKTKATWSVAQNYCRETYEDLATIESDLDWLRLRKEVERANLADIAWVGLYNDINSWRWSFNNVPLKDTYQEWYSGQPDLTGIQSCGLVGTLGWLWDNPCTDPFPVICYNANKTYAKRFVAVSYFLHWKQALAYCRLLHTDLAFSITPADYRAIQSITSNQGASWVGAFRDTWKWSDGTNPTYIPWLPAQPNNAKKSGNCAVLKEGMFDDTNCNELHYFICHITHPVREQQIIRLQIKSDASMSDSAMQSTISELIMKKLEEHDMLENVTVTWRVFSNGQVFDKKKEKPLI